MANASKPNPGALLLRGIGYALLALGAGCAMPAQQTQYPLANAGRPVKNAQGVCVQIGPMPANGKATCYQLAQPDLHHHVEPLPLDEFGYLFPPLKSVPKLASTSAPAATTRTAPIITAPTISTRTAAPVAAAFMPSIKAPAAAVASYTTKTLHFSTSMPFKLNSAHLSRENRAGLLAFVNSLERYRGIESIRITGHTDKSGPARFNMWLSSMRAKSVQLWLLSLGIDSRMVQIRGVGSSQPRTHALMSADNRYVGIEVIARTPAP
jgi:outer membrane protein OmpA-like peptidoglycan-associated protein